MKTLTKSTIPVTILILTGFSIFFSACKSEMQSDEYVKLGIYDSRIIAMAYYRSDLHKDYISQLMKEYNEAKEAGDTDRMEELQRIGDGTQDLAHKQGFSTMPIPQIIDKIKDSIPVVSERLGLDVIINKWALTYFREEVEFVDVSKELITFFNPSEETMNVVEQIYEVDPVPLSEVLKEEIETYCSEFSKHESH